MRARRLEAQAGIALPVAVIVLTTVMLLTAVSLLSATNSSRRTNQDLEEKLALQAANSGLDLARDRLNPSKLTTPLSALTPCLTLQAPVGTTLVKSVPSLVDGLFTGWCGAEEDRYDNGATSSYRISSNLAGNRTVVSTGRYGTTTRKVATTLGSTTVPQALFGNWAVSSYDDMVVTNTNVITGDVRTNNDIAMSVSGRINGSVTVNGALTMENSSRICTPGNVAYGSTAPNVNPYSSATICGTRTATAQPFTYPAIPASSVPTVATSNNARLCALNGASGSDTCTGNTYARGINASRVLTIGDGSSITLSGEDKPYLLCGISTYGTGKLIIPSGRDITVYIDTPENCPGVTQQSVISFTNTFQIDNRNCTVLGRPSDSLQFYVLGSTAVPSRVQWDSDSTGCATMFAPNSVVDVTNGVVLYGAVAAKQVTMSASGQILTTAGAQGITIPVPGGVGATTFRECVTSTGTAPDAGCVLG